MRLSIIIPVYNAEPYLERCLGSVLNQDIDDYEVIAINDGSADRSLEILEKTAATHPNGHRLCVLSHPNQGVSATRNRGIDEAAGEYIAFVDADDYVAENSLAAIFSQIQITSPYDIVFLGVKSVSRSGVESQYLKNDYFSGKLADFIDRPERLNYMDAPWGKFYRRKVLGNVRFNKEVKIHEDGCFNYALAPYCNEILSVDEHFYSYIHNYQSATIKFYGEKMVEWIEVLKDLQLHYYSHTGNLGRLLSQINRRFAFEYLFAIYSIYRSKGVCKKIDWLEYYWEQASESDKEWLAQFNRGIPKSIRIIGRYSKFMLHVWLKLVFGAEKIKRK